MPGKVPAKNLSWRLIAIIGDLMNSNHDTQNVAEHSLQDEETPKKIISISPYVWLFTILLAFGLGLAEGYILWGSGNNDSPPSNLLSDPEIEALIQQINPPEGYTLPVIYGAIGPQLIASGAIDYDLFLQVYQEAGEPLTEEQIEILAEGKSQPVVINQENAYFLLNFFWALGLTNQNAILMEGPMMQYGVEGVGSFASTGGWTLGARPATDLYSSTPIISLTAAQQARLEQVAAKVYRPCCNNPTNFPDCNHGMAMLGLLELMASQEASEDEMLEAAKYVNAFWFPQQTLEVAIYFQETQELSFAEIPPIQIVGGEFFSGSGFNFVHQWLLDNGMLDQTPGGGGSCGV